MISRPASLTTATSPLAPTMRTGNFGLPLLRIRPETDPTLIEPAPKRPRELHPQLYDPAAGSDR